MYSSFHQHAHVAVENGNTLSGYRLILVLAFPAHTVFPSQTTNAHTFLLRDHLVTTGTHAVRLLCSPTSRMNSCSVGVGTTCVMKPAVSRLLSEIQCSLRTCSISIDNEPRDTLLFFFFWLDALRACMACRLNNSVSPLVPSQTSHVNVIQIFDLDWNIFSFSQTPLYIHNWGNFTIFLRGSATNNLKYHQKCTLNHQIHNLYHIFSFFFCRIVNRILVFLFQVEKLDLKPDVCGDEDVEVKASYGGINFADSYLRQGVIPSIKFPFVLGLECVGVVENVGSGVQLFQVHLRQFFFFKVDLPFGKIAINMKISAF